MKKRFKEWLYDWIYWIQGYDVAIWSLIVLVGMVFLGNALSNG